ncbi:MAG: hypothetical protein L6R35_002197 [Caloplaca aegaea]|nr:MAG: hypothetical protein L6R35_002197 [Caloplaca aegaea]
MLAKDELILLIGIEAVAIAVAAAAADTHSAGLPREALAEALVPQGPVIGRGTGPLNVMPLLQEDGPQVRSTTQTANELREKLLREKVLALRKASTNAKE